MAQTLLHGTRTDALLDIAEGDFGRFWNVFYVYEH